MGLSAGTRLGPYEIVSALGAGGMGEVYRARDTRLERTVAIKVLNAALVSGPDAKARFEREAKAISQLNHPHICTLHDIGHDSGTDFLVMELLEGETLADRIKNKGALPLAELVKIGSEIADALDRAHRAGIVHRDLKPGNIMLTKSGAKLLDFGLAKPTAMGAAAASGTAPLLSAAMTMTSPSPQHSPITQQGALIGTVQYMSPEQIQGMEADSRSDIFALGAVLYEMATGKHAFEGKSQIKVASAILEDQPQPISVVVRTSPPALEQLIRSCLAKNPDERLQSARDVKIQLQWVAESPVQVATRSAGAAANIVWMVLTLLFGLGLLGAGYFAYTSAKPNPVLRATLLPPDRSSFVTGLTASGPPAISPDGTQLAFTAQDEKGAIQLYVRGLNSLTAQSLDGTQNALYPFWSADSRSVGFFADGKLKRIEATGGPAQVLADAAGTAAPGGTWSADGTIVFAPKTGELMSVPARGGTATAVSKLGADETAHRWPVFLPDGKHYLFFAAGSKMAVAVGELGSTEHKVLFENASHAIYANGYLLFVREDTLMAQPFSLSNLSTTGDPVPLAEHVNVNTTFRGVIAASNNGVLVYQGAQDSAGWTLAWVDRDGKHSDFADLGRYFGPSISPDGKQVAVAVSERPGANQDIWIYDLARSTKTRLTFGPAADQYPAWTPDGKHVFFVSDRKGTFEIYSKAADNSGTEEPVVVDQHSKGWMSVSGDGKWIAYQRFGEKTGLDIWAMPLTGDRKAFPVVQTDAVEVEPQISPDGKWLAYSSTVSGQLDVFITAFPGGGAKWQVSSSGGRGPRWRGDGKELYFISGARQMMAVDVNAGASSVALGTPHALFAVNAQEGPAGPYDVTRDGKRFLINTVSSRQASNPLTVVVNWPTELKK